MRFTLPLLLTLLCASTATMAAAPAPDPKGARTLIDEAKRVNDHDLEGSIRLLDRALSLLGPGDGALRLEALSKKCWWTAYGDPASAIPIAAAGLAEAGDPKFRADLHLCRGYAYEQNGRIDYAGKDYEIGVQEGERIGNQEILAKALAQRGEFRYYRGDFGDALVDLQKAYELNVARKDEGAGATS
jgi:tetratricopeptide (TPR) repeat protein